MNIVVAMKQIPDLQQVRIRNRQPVFEDVPLTLGNIDKNALEAGVTLKEAADAKLFVVSAGNEELEDTVKEALAAGADEAFLVIDDALDHISSDVSAALIAGAVKKIDAVGIILFGEGSGDNYSGQVASRVAEILDLPQIGYAKAIELADNKVKVVRSLEDCEEVVESELPVVISVVSDINEVRIPSVTQILKAGKKPKEVVEPDDLDIAINAKPIVATLSNLAPESARKGIAVKSVDELVKALTTEGLIGR
ncbi:MAG TPA: electron transfer flavoprotein subunit beta/FixA family protein [Syntrophomonas sp.]|nr:electron transfer flavoprotein subunit beta/FixA family protein [Syntrophomonas sp.]HRW12428.1 electron transfer flavoprotein subunit beta/FixA family protein [Syntrophomonas sp.]